MRSLLTMLMVAVGLATRAHADLVTFEWVRADMGFTALDPLTGTFDTDADTLFINPYAGKTRSSGAPIPDLISGYTLNAFQPGYVPFDVTPAMLTDASTLTAAGLGTTFAFVGSQDYANIATWGSAVPTAFGPGVGASAVIPSSNFIALFSSGGGFAVGFSTATTGFAQIPDATPTLTAAAAAEVPEGDGPLDLLKRLWQ